ncbi:hypothetical protein ACFLRB_00805 [Acidobacteriota bacterium]
MQKTLILLLILVLIGSVSSGEKVRDGGNARITKEQKPAAQEKTLSEIPEYQKEVGKYLEGAAQYCKKLKQAAFHCWCKEKVVETHSKINLSSRYAVSDISSYENRANTKNIMRRNASSARNNFRKKVIKYAFDYQMINKGGEIKEQRKLLSKSSPELKIRKDRANWVIYTFLMEKVIFGPVTLLLKEQQEKLKFELVRFEKHKGRSFAVIKAVPKTIEDVPFVYGEVWIDTGDYSVLRIRLDPPSIQGYEKLTGNAKRLKTRLFLDCVLEYDTIHQGIRFPIQVTISEKYKGGPVLNRVIGGKTWERINKIIFYKDYRFFDVDASEEEANFEKTKK